MTTNNDIDLAVCLFTADDVGKASDSPSEWHGQCSVGWND